MKSFLLNKWNDCESKKNQFKKKKTKQELEKLKLTQINSKWNKQKIVV